MRRGLIARSPDELPDAVLEARLDRLRAAMVQAHLDALIVYTNNTRPAGVSWLTGFVPYWSEALLLVPRAGDPVLVVALTYRVKTWIERTSRVAEVIHTPRIGLEAGRRIAAQKPDAAVGIVEFDTLSAGIADDLKQAAPRLALTDASELFARQRARADEAEIALATKAAHIAHRALARVPRDATDAGQAIAAVEATARTMGAEEIYLAAATDLGGDECLRRVEGQARLGRRFALRATVAYQGTWVRIVRTVERDGAAAEPAIARFAATLTRLPDTAGFADFRAWLIEGCRTTQPLDTLIGSRAVASPAPLPGLVSVQAHIDVDGQPVLVGCPVVIEPRGARPLVSPTFE